MPPETRNTFEVHTWMDADTGSRVRLFSIVSRMGCDGNVETVFQFNKQVFADISLFSVIFDGFMNNACELRWMAGRYAGMRNVPSRYYLLPANPTHLACKDPRTGHSCCDTTIGRTKINNGIHVRSSKGEQNCNRSLLGLLPGSLVSLSGSVNRWLFESVYVGVWTYLILRFFAKSQSIHTLWLTFTLTCCDNDNNRGSLTKTETHTLTHMHLHMLSNRESNQPRQYIMSHEFDLYERLGPKFSLLWCRCLGMDAWAHVCAREPSSSKSNFIRKHSMCEISLVTAIEREKDGVGYKMFTVGGFQSSEFCKASRKIHNKFSNCREMAFFSSFFLHFPSFTGTSRLCGFGLSSYHSHSKRHSLFKRFEAKRDGEGKGKKCDRLPSAWAPHVPIFSLQFHLTSPYARDYAWKTIHRRIRPTASTQMSSPTKSTWNNNQLR